MGYGIAPLMVVALSGSSSLAGMSVGLFAVSRFLVAYPVGKITDAHGRKPGIILGLLLSLAGTVTLGLAMQNASLVGLTVGLLAMGMGLSAAQQLRVAAADMYPPNMRSSAGVCRGGFASRLVNCATPGRSGPCVWRPVRLVAPSATVADFARLHPNELRDRFPDSPRPEGDRRATRPVLSGIQAAEAARWNRR